MVNIGNIQLGFWDIMLFVAVSVQAVMVAYLYDPRWKALLYTLPIPFTISSMSIGQRIGASNALGLIFLMIFSHLVRLLYYRLRVPIVLSIIISAALYCVLSLATAKILPQSESAFWLCVLGVAAMAFLYRAVVRADEDQGQKSTLAVWLKVPAICVVVAILIVLKHRMGGFMTAFPMVGVIVAYETRKSLGTICRQMPVLMLTILVLTIVSHVTSPHIGLGPSIALAWPCFGLSLYLGNRFLINPHPKFK